MKTPQVGDMWEWEDSDWSVVVLVSDRDTRINYYWNCICLWSTDGSEVGTRVLMSFADNTLDDWTFLA